MYIDNKILKYLNTYKRTQIFRKKFGKVKYNS